MRKCFKPSLSLLGCAIAAAAAGLAPGTARASYSSDGTVTNSGTITAPAYFGGTIINVGTMPAEPASSGSGSYLVHGIYIGAMAEVSVVNSGNITASDYGLFALSMTSSVISNSGHITIASASGSDLVSGWGIVADSLGSSSSISNSGSIEIAFSAGSDGYLYGIQASDLHDTSIISNTGAIRVSGSAGTWLSAYGINVDELFDSSSVSNSGTIVATATSLSSSASAWGIHTGELNSGSVTNSGDIAITVSAPGAAQWAGAYGLGSSRDWVAMNGVTVSNTVDGIITASAAADSAAAHGIFLWGALGNGSSISNAGSISVNVTGGTDWAGAYGMYLGSVGSSSTVTNSGTITATASVTGSSATGTAYGIYIGGLAAGATFSNSGTVTATGGNPIDVVGIFVGSGDGDLTNTRTGNIVGGVRLSGTVSMANAGNLTLPAGRVSTVGGDYLQGATGQLTAVVKDASTYGQIAVTGSADFSASGKLVVALDPSLVMATGTVLSDIVTAGTLVAPGSYDIVDSSLFWSFANVGDAATIDLVATKVDAATAFAGSGTAFNQSQLDLVNAVVSGGYGPTYSALFRALNTAPTPAAAAAIVQQVNPALSGSVGRVALGASRGIGALIGARQAEAGASSGDDLSRNAVWLKTYIGSADQDVVNGVSGFDADTTGFVLGLDGSVSDSWRLGVAVATAATDVESINASLDIDTLQFTVYGGYAVTDTTTLDLDLGHTVNSVDSRRRLGFAGSTAVAGYDGSQFALGAGLTHRASVGGKMAVLSGVALRYQQVHLDGYSETGAGAFDLTVDGRSDSGLLWQARLGLEVPLGGYGTMLANAGVGYDTLDAASASATLSGNGPTLVSEGAKPESTVLNAGLGYRYVMARGFEVNALYELEDRDTFTASTASLKFRMLF